MLDTEMNVVIGGRKPARTVYGFDDISLVPGNISVNPQEVDVSFVVPGKEHGDISLEVPILASAMDGVTDVRFCTELGRLGGLGVINLLGVQTRYADPEPVIDEIRNAPDHEVTSLLQHIYTEPVQEKLIENRIHDLKSNGVAVAVSCSPQKASQYIALARQAGADLVVIQSLVSSVKHISSQYTYPGMKDLCDGLDIPVVAGNVATYSAAMDLMEAGVAGVLVGIGNGASCTSSLVFGMGVSQASATSDCAAARDDYFSKHGKYVPIITDGGVHQGADLCKALACGADAVMMGTTLARASEAPGKGCYWGMAAPHLSLPLGSRIHTGHCGSLKSILFGPSETGSGTQNMIGALTACMGFAGAADIREFQKTEVVVNGNPGSSRTN